MDWTTLDIDNLLASLTEPERAALRSAATKPGQADPLETVRADVTAYVRGAIQSGGGSLADAGTVPAGAVFHATALWRYRVLTRLPKDSFISEARNHEREAAEAYFGKVSEGKITFPAPDAVTEGPAESAGAQLVVPACRPSRRNTAEGLAGL